MDNAGTAPPSMYWKMPKNKPCQAVNFLKLNQPSQTFKTGLPTLPAGKTAKMDYKDVCFGRLHLRNLWGQTPEAARTTADEITIE